MVIYGFIQDKLDLKRTLLIFVSAIMALAGPFVQFVYAPLLKTNLVLGAAVGGVFLSAGFIGSTGLFEAYVERLSRRHGFEFGQARMWGSFGYAIVALAAGLLFPINPYMLFWIGSCLGVVELAIQIFWHPETEDNQSSRAAASTPSLNEMVSLLGNARVWIVIGFVFLSWTFYTVFDQQMFPAFYTSLFDTEAMGQNAYGVLNSIQVFLEAIMMSVVAIAVRRLGARKTLLLGVAVMLVRILLCGLFDTAILISCAKLFHSLEVPLFVLGIFEYFSLHFSSSLSATLYLVAFNLASQVGNIILSAPLGSLRDRIGYQPTFFVIVGVVAVAAIWAFLLLEKDEHTYHASPSGEAGLQQ